MELLEYLSWVQCTKKTFAQLPDRQKMGEGRILLPFYLPFPRTNLRRKVLFLSFSITKICLALGGRGSPSNADLIRK